MSTPGEVATKRPRSGDRRTGRMARTALTWLGAIASVLVVIAIIVTLLALYERATNRQIEGGSITGMISDTAHSNITLTLDRVDKATDAQADAWGYDKLTQSNSPDDGTPYVATFTVKLPKGTIKATDWTGFIWGLRDSDNSVDTSIAATDDAPGVQGCAITAKDLTTELNRSGTGTFCALIRSRHFPAQASYTALYESTNTRGLSSVHQKPAKWDINHVGTWKGNSA